jgi:predicted cation transporter
MTFPILRSQLYSILPANGRLLVTVDEVPRVKVQGRLRVVFREYADIGDLVQVEHEAGDKCH